MPRGIHKDAQHLHDILDKGVILDKDRVEGDTIDLSDDTPVCVGIIVDVNGYGPHVGAMYVEQNQFHGHPDSALQAADEILTEWTLDHADKEDIDELEAKHGDEWMEVLTETFDGWAFKLSPQEFVEAIKGTDAEGLVDIEEEEEEEGVLEESTVSEPNDARDILEGLGQYMEHEGHDAPRESARIARMIAGVRGNSDRADKVLEEVNRLVDGHGIEAIRDENAWDNYYGDTVALYVNMGDTYETTLLYDTRTHEFQVTSWGDWYEAYEAEQEEDEEPEDEDEEGDD